MAMAAMVSGSMKMNNEQFKSHKREAHFIMGEHPIYIPQRKKLKGYKKDAMRNNKYNKFRKS